MLTLFLSLFKKKPAKTCCVKNSPSPAKHQRYFNQAMVLNAMADKELYTINDVCRKLKVRTTKRNRHAVELIFYRLMKRKAVQRIKIDGQWCYGLPKKATK